MVIQDKGLPALSCRRSVFILLDRSSSLLGFCYAVSLRLFLLNAQTKSSFKV